MTTEEDVREWKKYKLSKKKGLHITVVLEDCSECRHIDHSGSFTHGGARVICGHPDSTKVRRSKTQFRKEYPEYRLEMKAEKWQYWSSHWYHRILPSDDSIPEWCPLKHGSEY